MRYLKSIFTLLFIWFITHVSYSIIDGIKNDQYSSDVAVILGNKVHKDGRLSVRLEKRLECGLSLYNDKRVKQIIVSGGLGKEGHYEAEIMKIYLLNHGVKASDILVDNYGNNTRLTVKNTLRLKEKHKFSSIIVVSQYYHITRIKMLFKKHDVYVHGVSPDYFEPRDIFSIPREFIAYYTQCF